MTDTTRERNLTFVHKDEQSIYHQGRELLGVSTIIYCAADLRELARQGKLSGDPELIEQLLGDGISIKEKVIQKVFHENKQILLSEFGAKDCEVYIKAIETLLQDRIDDAESRIITFDDENSKSELVYAVALDSKSKQVVVIFRGSATSKDWMVDSKMYLADVPNPVETDDQRVIGVHAGFYEYLFGSSTSKKPGVAHNTKYEKILLEVSSLLEENPGYHLCTTGHSLGAALATLFAFMAAASSDPCIPKPVMTINFASPRAGNTHFQDAFRRLEKEGKIRCLRVANNEDVITQMPDRHVWGCCVCPARMFRHVGMELSLFKRNDYKFIYPGTDKWTRRFQRDFRKCLIQTFFCSTLALRNPFNYMAYHSCQEYLSRLERESDELNKVKLHELYEGHFEGTQTRVIVSLAR